MDKPSDAHLSNTSLRRSSVSTEREVPSPSSEPLQKIFSEGSETTLPTDSVVNLTKDSGRSQASQPAVEPVPPPKPPDVRPAPLGLSNVLSALTLVQKNRRQLSAVQEESHASQSPDAGPALSAPKVPALELDKQSMAGDTISNAPNGEEVVDVEDKPQSSLKEYTPYVAPVDRRTTEEKEKAEMDNEVRKLEELIGASPTLSDTEAPINETTGTANANTAPGVPPLISPKSTKSIVSTATRVIQPEPRPATGSTQPETSARKELELDTTQKPTDFLANALPRQRQGLPVTMPGIDKTNNNTTDEAPIPNPDQKNNNSIVIDATEEPTARTQASEENSAADTVRTHVDDAAAFDHNRNQRIVRGNQRPSSPFRRWAADANVDTDRTQLSDRRLEKMLRPEEPVRRPFDPVVVRPPNSSRVNRNLAPASPHDALPILSPEMPRKSRARRYLNDNNFNDPQKIYEAVRRDSSMNPSDDSSKGTPDTQYTNMGDDDDVFDRHDPHRETHPRPNRTTHLREEAARYRMSGPHPTGFQRKNLLGVAHPMHKSTSEPNLTPRSKRHQGAPRSSRGKSESPQKTPGKKGARSKGASRSRSNARRDAFEIQQALDRENGRYRSPPRNFGRSTPPRSPSVSSSSSGGSIRPVPPRRGGFKPKRVVPEEVIETPPKESLIRRPRPPEKIHTPFSIRPKLPERSASGPQSPVSLKEDESILEETKRRVASATQPSTLVDSDAVGLLTNEIVPHVSSESSDENQPKVVTKTEGGSAKNEEVPPVGRPTKTLSLTNLREPQPPLPQRPSTVAARPSPIPEQEEPAESKVEQKTAKSGTATAVAAGGGTNTNDQKKAGKKDPEDSGKTSDDKDKSQKDKDAAAAEADQTARRKRPKVSTADQTKRDNSLKVLRMARKDEWVAVDNYLRSIPKNDIDLNVKDEDGMALLHHAVKDGKLHIIDRVMQLGGDVNEPTKDGLTAAHLAAQYNPKEDILAHLASHHRLDLTKTAGPKGQLPIHVACSRPGPNMLPVVYHLLRMGPAQGKQDTRFVEDSNGAIPLHLAIQSGHGSIIRELLSVEPERQMKIARRDNGETALHMACRRRDMDLVRHLVELGANVNVQNKDGITPLHIVATNGEESILRVLYQARADANIADKEDKTPLHLAAEHGHTGLVEILCDKFKASVLARTKDGSTLMHIASRNGHPETAVAFLKRGVPLHMPNKAGWLGLHSAAACGHVHVIRTLLTKGANVDTRTKEGLTALHIAVQNCKPASVECLLGYGSDVHLRSYKTGETPLHLAANLDGPTGLKVAEMLLKSGAENNITTEDGETPMHLAARRGNSHMVKLLLEDGGDPSMVSTNGESALHVAARHCHYAVSKLILDHMEKTKKREAAVSLVNLKSQDGESSMHYSCEILHKSVHYPSEDKDVVKLLLGLDGDVGMRTSLTGETPIHYSARSGNEHVLKEILKRIGAGEIQIALNRQSKTGWSPLLYASEKGHEKVVEILLKHHARVDVFDEHGRTALHLAAEQGHIDVADVLLQHKAFINSKTKQGVTPLHLAAMYGHHDVVNLLTNKHGAMLDAIALDSRTPLHLAAKYGKLAVCTELISMGANSNARDSKGQTPLHLAAESDYPEIVKIFLKMKPDLNTLTATDETGFTCAHIAAMKGSVAVIKELMSIDKTMVIDAKTKTTESNTLHLSAAGGHPTVVEILLEAGSSPTTETMNGMTPIHLAAKYGHVSILNVLDRELWVYCSKKTGLTPLHVAAHFGQSDFVQYMLTAGVPATLKSEPPVGVNPLMVKELQTEFGLTPLHMASQSGHEGLVRLLLNANGVVVDTPTALQSVIPLHLAAQCGHVAVVGLLLSRSTHQLHIKDSKGRTSLHLAAMNGHYDMVSLLIGQGSSINTMDLVFDFSYLWKALPESGFPVAEEGNKSLKLGSMNGWTSLHFATKAGHLSVVKLLVQAGGDPIAETKHGKVPMCFAAAHNHNSVLSFLVRQEHDTYTLMEDRKFIFDLMVAGKSNNYKPIEEFILLSAAPIDTAVKLSSLYREMSTKEKERGKDLAIVSEYCEDIAVELLSIASTTYNASVLLKAVDNRHRPFLDVLIEHEQKKVVSHATVQRYLTEIWNGGINWGDWKFLIFFIALLLCPPLFFIFSLPTKLSLSKAPIIKFICHLVSHMLFTVLLTVEILGVFQEIYEINSWVPLWFEWFLLLWLSGMLVAELSNPDSRSGLGILKTVMLLFSAVAVLMHVVAFIYPYYIEKAPTEKERVHSRNTLLYVKNQFFASALLVCFGDFLEFLTVHHLFGPWAIIIRDLMYDLTRFLAILSLFIAGFTLHVTSIFKPAYASEDGSEERLASPVETLEMLFFSLFGLVEPDQMPPVHRTPYFAGAILKIVFGIYMMVTLIVLINLLIAMMSDTYQRIQAQSDTEWKFGRAKLIRQMNKKSATAPPVNIFTKFFMVLKVAWKNRGNLCSVKAQDDMRHEENIDSFSTGSHQDRSTPSNLNKDEIDEAEIQVKVEDGEVGQVSIDRAIDWKRVVDTFYMYQGAPEDETEEEKKDELQTQNEIIA